MSTPLSRYLRDVGPASIAYFISVAAAALLSKRVELFWLRCLIGLMPLPTIAWLAWAEFSRLRRRDELRQRIELEAMAIGFLVSILGVAMLAFFDLFGIVKLGMPVAALFMSACWACAQVWVRTRYRYWWSDAEPEPENHHN